MSASASVSASNRKPIESNIASLINSTKVFLKALTRWTQSLETQKSISNHYVTLGNDFQVVVKQFTNEGINMSGMRNVPKELRVILEKALKEEPSNESLDKYWPAIKEIIESLLNTIKLKRIELKRMQQEGNKNDLNGKKRINSDLNEKEGNNIYLNEKEGNNIYLNEKEGNNSGLNEQESNKNDSTGSESILADQLYTQSKQNFSKGSLSSGSVESLQLENPASPDASGMEKSSSEEDYVDASGGSGSVDISSTDDVGSSINKHVYDSSAENKSGLARNDAVKTETIQTGAVSNSSLDQKWSAQNSSSVNTPSNKTGSTNTPLKSKLDPDSELKKKKLSNFLSMSGFNDDDDDEDEEYFDDSSDEDDDLDEKPLSGSKLVINELKKDTKLERRASKRYSAYHITKHNGFQEQRESLSEKKKPETSDSTASSPSKKPLSAPVTHNLANDIAQKRNTSSNFDANSDKLSAILKNKVANNHEQQKQDSKSIPSSIASAKSTSSSAVAKTASSAEKVLVPESVPGYQKTGFITIFLKYNGQTVRTETTFPVKTSLKSLFAEKFSLLGKNPGEFECIDPKYPGIYYTIIDELDELKQITDGFVVQLTQGVKKEEQAADNNITFSEESINKLQDYIEKSQSSLFAKVEKLVHAKISTVKGVEDSQSKVDPLNFENIESADLKELRDENSILRKEVVKMDASHKEEISKLEKQLAQSLSQVDMLKKNQVSENNKNNDSKEMADLKYITLTSNKISSDGDSILNKVDDLQDVIEILRKDVAVRGVKPKTSNLEAIKKELDLTETKLQDFDKFLKQNKPQLKSSWEAQLVSICDQQQLLSLQEDLILDLRSDLEKCKETLDLVILCSEERSKKSKTGGEKKQVYLPLVKPGDLNGVRDQLLQDIELLKPDHKSRVEAIEKHEKFSEINK